MKNATTKHHVIEATTGIKDDKYSLVYTTCPEKSYVVKPDDGEINYNKVNSKNLEKFIDKVINGEVEKIKIKEDHSPTRSPMKSPAKSPKSPAKSPSKSPAKSPSPKKASPVKITKKHCKRGSRVSH